MGLFFVKGGLTETRESPRYQPRSSDTSVRAPGTWPISGWVPFSVLRSSLLSSLLSSETPTFNIAKWNYDLICEADPVKCHPE